MGYLSRAAFARESGRNCGEVDRLLGLGLPHEVVGNGRGSEIRIPLGSALSWLAGFVLDARDEPGGGSSPELTRERARLAKEQADKVALENAVARGELLPAAEVAKVDEVVFTALRDRVLQVESTATVLCDLAVAGKPGEARALLRQAPRDALEDLGSAELVQLEGRAAAS
jgi:phage terminase Nu1 subunit (DNA packaging protein)